MRILYFFVVFFLSLESSCFAMEEAFAQNPQKKSNFSDIPDEVLAKICESFPPKDVKEVAKVSKSFNQRASLFFRKRLDPSKVLHTVNLSTESQKSTEGKTNKRTHDDAWVDASAATTSYPKSTGAKVAFFIGSEKNDGAWDLRTASQGLFNDMIKKIYGDYNHVIVKQGSAFYQALCAVAAEDSLAAPPMAGAGFGAGATASAGLPMGGGGMGSAASASTVTSSETEQKTKMFSKEASFDQWILEEEKEVGWRTKIAYQHIDGSHAVLSKKAHLLQEAGNQTITALREMLHIMLNLEYIEFKDDETFKKQNQAPYVLVKGSDLEAHKGALTTYFDSHTDHTLVLDVGEGPHVSQGTLSLTVEQLPNTVGHLAWSTPKIRSRFKLVVGGY